MSRIRRDLMNQQTKQFWDVCKKCQLGVRIAVRSFHARGPATAALYDADAFYLCDVSRNYTLNSHFILCYRFVLYDRLVRQVYWNDQNTCRMTTVMDTNNVSKNKHKKDVLKLAKNAAQKGVFISLNLAVCSHVIFAVSTVSKQYRNSFEAVSHQFLFVVRTV